jgi:hypothetical protein
MTVDHGAVRPEENDWPLITQFLRTVHVGNGPLVVTFFGVIEPAFVVGIGQNISRFLLVTHAQANRLRYVSDGLSVVTQASAGKPPVVLGRGTDRIKFDGFLIVKDS